MSDTSQGHNWWLASDGKWYPPESRPLPPASPPESPAPPPRMEPWPLNQEQQRKRRYDEVGPPSPRVVLAAWWGRQGWRVKAPVLIVCALVVLLVAGGLTYLSGRSDSGPSADKPSVHLAECEQTAAVQTVGAGYPLDANNPAAVEIASAYVNRCIALAEGLDPCGWALRAASGDKPVAGCGRYSYLPLTRPPGS